MDKLRELDLKPYKGRMTAGILLNDLMLEFAEEEGGPNAPQAYQRKWFDVQEWLLLAAYYAGETVYGETDKVSQSLQNMREAGRVIDLPEEEEEEEEEEPTATAPAA